MNLPADLLDLRYRAGKDAGHVESWFFVAHEPGGRRAFTTKIALLVPTDPAVPPVAEAWSIAFDRDHGHVATKVVVPLAGARFARGTLDVEVDACRLTLRHAVGALTSGPRKLAWDLETSGPRAAPIRHLPHAWLYRTSLPPSKLVSPLSDTRASGTVDVTRGDGAPPERWSLDGWPAMVGHHWGSAMPRFYAWAHCNTWDGADDLVFEAATSRVRMGPVLLSPMLTAVFVRWQGQTFDLNAGELFGKNRGSVSLRRFEVHAASRAIEVQAELSAETDDFVGLHLANPSGALTYLLDTKLARVRLELALPGKPKAVVTSRAGALEIGTRDRDHGVRMVL
ncbi:MAG: hypothetical protein JWP97_3592 [Labilithrix sp.]|nr:hypothetical protein [Labilithrix sp.]